MNSAVKKVVLPVLGVTTLLIGYVYQQSSILQVSYRLSAKEERCVKLSDEYQKLSYKFASLQSPNKLEERMSKNHLEMVPAKRVVIVKRLVHTDGEMKLAKNNNSFLDWKRWLGLETEAQAKPSDLIRNPYPLSVHRSDG